MSDSERPRPQYGEYSSGEELASARERAGVDPSHLEPPPPRANASAMPTPPAPLPSQRRPGSAPASHRTESSAFDRLATVFFLAFGAVFILGGASGYLNLGETIQQLTEQYGKGEFHPTQMTGVIGIVMLATQIALWVLAAVWSFRRISNRKLAWWVPLVIGAINFIALMVFLSVVLLADPAFMDSLSTP